MNAGALLAMIFIGAMFGLIGGFLKAFVDGSMGARFAVAGAVGGVIASSMMGDIDATRGDALLLALCGFLAADVYEAMRERR